MNKMRFADYRQAINRPDPQAGLTSLPVSDCQIRPGTDSQPTRDPPALQSIPASQLDLPQRFPDHYTTLNRAS